MIPPIGIGPLGPGEWSVSGVGGVGGVGGGIGGLGANAAAAPAGGASSFGSALTNAIGQLDSTQSAASTAAQQLATGQLTDPTQAVTAVENASLSMDFAAQIRNQLTSDATTLFGTQI